jgi:hypothetical protein
VGCGHDGDADGEAGGEKMVEGADGGVLAGIVGIEAEDDFVGVALEDAGVLIGEGGALGGDDVLDAVGEAGDEIELAFADDGEAGVEDGALLVKMAVSGELTFLAVFSSPARTRPLKATTRPCSSQMGNMRRPRKRS